METNDNAYELLYMVRQKDEAAFKLLIRKYEETVRFIIFKYMRRQNHTMDQEDYFQLALLKLLQAIDTYREDKETSFSYFYLEIIRHTMIDYYRELQSYWGTCELYSLSLDTHVEEANGPYCLLDYVKGPQENSERYYEVQHLINETKETLNELEKKIIDFRSMGYSYRQIAYTLHINEKKVDNTLRKARIYKRSKR